MKRASTFALTIAVLLSGAVPAKSQSESPLVAMPPASAGDPIARPQQIIDSSGPQMQELAKWALGRYRLAGLDLPHIDLYFHSDDEPCGGYSALHKRLESGSRIDVCSLRRTPKVEGTLLHELAHAWAAHSLTDDQRQAFVELQGLDTWHDKDTSWSQRGTEQAAEIIAWGIAETSHRPRTIANNDPDSLTVAFQQLTGTHPITEIADEWRPGQPIPEHH